MVKLSLILTLLLMPFVGLAQSWQSLAKEVGENELGRTNAMNQLRAMPNLKEHLRAELNSPDRFLVYDVISALKLEEMKADLLQGIEEDSDGFSVLTLSSLMTPGNYKELLRAYKSHLYSPKDLSPGVIVALIEPFGRLGQELNSLSLSYFLQHSSHEVRMAVVHYIRDYSLKTKSSKFQAFYPLFLQAKPFQVRLAALFFMTELEASQFPESVRSLIDLDFCKNESKISLRQLCRRLVQRIKDKG